MKNEMIAKMIQTFQFLKDFQINIKRFFLVFPPATKGLHTPCFHTFCVFYRTFLEVSQSFQKDQEVKASREVLWQQKIETRLGCFDVTAILS